MKFWKRFLAAGLIAAAGYLPAQARPIYQEPPPQTALVAQSASLWSGVAVLPSGRIFVSYPASESRPAFSVAEIAGGRAQPRFEDMVFSSVQSLVATEDGHLWLLDAGRAEGVSAAGATPRILLADPVADAIETIYEIPAEVMLPDSSLDDLRVDTAAGCVYLTDAGHGGVLVLDLTSGEAWRALTDIPEVRANLQSIYFHKTGVYNTATAHSDGLELSKDRKNLYFSALGGDCLYAIPTAVLRDRSKSVAERQKAIVLLSMFNVPNDGMVLRDNCLFMGDLADEAIWRFDLTETNKKEAGSMMVELQRDFRWPASFALGPDKSVYFITVAANYPKDQQPPYELYRMAWTKSMEIVDYQ